MGSGGEDARSASFTDSLAKYTDSTFAAVYSGQYTRSDGRESVVTARLVKSGDEQRVELTMSSGGRDDQRYARIEEVDGTVECVVAQAADGVDLCYTNEDPVLWLVPSLMMPLRIDPELANLFGSNFRVRSERQDTIAGASAQCFKLIPNDSSTDVDFEFELCFGDDGALVRTRLSGEEIGFDLTATSVSRTVTEADLEAPYEVIDGR
jgi:hypothetical protein